MQLKEIKPEEIKQIIEATLQQSTAIVKGDGKHFTALVISTAFTGKSRIQKQQLVYNAVAEQIANGTLHALSIKTFTPEEWQAQN